MSDDFTKAMELIPKMEAHLPIPARPTGPLIDMLRQQGIKIKPGQELQIKQVLYLGDEGGISCDVTPPDSWGAKMAVVVSITQLRIDPGHPLAREIRTYQRERTTRIVRAGRTGLPTAVMIYPPDEPSDQGPSEPAPAPPRRRGVRTPPHKKRKRRRR
jgi:hypothetical protein